MAAQKLRSEAIDRRKTTASEINLLRAVTKPPSAPLRIPGGGANVRPGLGRGPRDIVRSPHPTSMVTEPSALQRQVARHIVTRCLRVRPGENAVIERSPRLRSDPGSRQPPLHRGPERSAHPGRDAHPPRSHRSRRASVPRAGACRRSPSPHPRDLTGSTGCRWEPGSSDHNGGERVSRRGPSIGVG